MNTPYQWKVICKLCTQRSSVWSYSLFYFVLTGSIDLEHVQVQDCPMWIPELNLFESDRSVIESNAWLNDNIVFAAMKLLEKQVQTKGRHIYGWQSTQNRKSMSFKALPPGAKFVQIFHLGDHWITASNVICGDHKTVRIYDSLHTSKRPSLDLMQQICSLVHPNSDLYRFDVMNVQSQKNGSDCGIFAIAYATQLAYGHDPIQCQWKVGVMRNHLLKCFEKQMITPFPLEKERRITMGNRVRKSHEENIHCTCRMPNDKNLEMVCCDYCNRWFHRECEGLDPDGDYASRSVKWKCSVCISFVEDHV